MQKAILILPVLILCIAGPAGRLHAAEGRGGLLTQTVISEPIAVDRVYKSMQGPYVKRPIPIPLEGAAAQSDMLWLKKVSLEFLDGNEDEPRPLSHLCHGHLLMQDPRVPALFTLIQGQNAIELPGNFAVPVPAGHPLIYYAQILNLKDTEEPFDLRVKTTVDYMPASEATASMKPLFQISMILKFPIDAKTAEMIAQKEHCSLASQDGTVEIVSSGELGLRSDSRGNDYSIHWNVPPGRHTYSYDIKREEIKANEGATIHFATIHLHPYGRSLELLDLTTNTSVFKIDAAIDPENGGIERVDPFYSETGVPLHLDHQYRITTEYDNPTQNSVDAMAILYLYVYDKEFEKAVRLDLDRLSQNVD